MILFERWKKTFIPSVSCNLIRTWQCCYGFLQERYDLYIYTNNGFFLTGRILALLGVDDCFRQIYSLEFAWRPKPDAEALQLLLADIGGLPESFLFIGDRYHVDLREPEKLGIPVFPVHTAIDLLRLPSVLGITS